MDSCVCAVPGVLLKSEEPGAIVVGERRESWLAELYDRHGAAMYAYASALVRDAEMAADAVQESFTSLARLPRALIRIREPEFYLRRTVRNRCYSMLRARRIELATSEMDTERALSSGSTPGAIDVILDVRRALENLPVDLREVVYLKIVEGLTFREIAHATRANPHTVASRYRSAIRSLRREFSGRE